MPAKPTQFYFVEITDTFGGESNYSWVRRYKVKSTSMRGAVMKVSREHGWQGRLIAQWNDGEVTAHRVDDANIIMFTQLWDEKNLGKFEHGNL